MVKRAEKDYLMPDGSINITAWLQTMHTVRPPDAMRAIQSACSLCELAGSHQRVLGDTDCFSHAIKMAEILDDLSVDRDTIISALLYPIVQYQNFPLEDVNEQFGESIEKMIRGIIRMDVIRSLETQPNKRLTQSHMHIDNVRKMLLAMIDDVRVVLIKLVERVTLMHAAKSANEGQRQFLATETLDIYAPLANRLGIGSLKWELEDLSFHYLEPDIYKRIASMLAERRVDRDRYVNGFVQTLGEAIERIGVRNAVVQGRAKHIYSIHKKMQRKNVDFDQIFDVRAVRVLVDTVEDCYAVLGEVHGTYEHVPEEFDDYITAPKPNGYRSIHTAIKGPEDKIIEVQIRTREMHDESELGVAAHWMYKEGSQKTLGLQDKILWLRQILDWQREMSSTGGIFETVSNELFDDRIYVFTPDGEIKDLSLNATPLDFAYHIHSEIGHRCRGAKVNDKIVPLTHKLKTGDRVEILTAKRGEPSRDWLSPQLGYLGTARARAKVHHWFKKQDYDLNLHEGTGMLERELKRYHLKIGDLNMNDVLHRFNFKTKNDLLASIGAGDTRVAQITTFIKQSEQEAPTDSDESETLAKLNKSAHISKLKDEIIVEGLTHINTVIARCCKPVPGDDIVGYITKDRGISVHQRDCKNLHNARHDLQHKLISVQWGESQNVYSVDLFIKAYHQQGLISDLTSILSSEKINLIGLTTSHDKAESTYYTTMTIEITNVQMLTKIIDRIKQLPNVVLVERLTGQ